MELRPGYKRTEVGMVPEDWEVDNLERFWAITDCKHLTADFVDVGIPVASIKEVQSRFVDLGHANQTTEFYYSKLIEGGRIPLPGDLIFSRNATVGEAAQVAEWHPLFAMGQDVCLLRKKSLAYSSDYLQEVIRSPIVVTQLENLMVGSTFKRVNVEQIKGLKVPMPGANEQHAIAKVLVDVENLIAALDRLIAKKCAIKQGAMQRLLTGKTRLPGFSGEWEVKALGDVLDYEQPVKYLVKDTEYIDTGTPVLTAGKTFILGHTDEQEGIYTNLPVIVFDDFTTASRYVDFPFKIKSSAIKLLTAKSSDVDLRFVFERMQTIQFALGDHKRYYISEYQHIKTRVPPPHEQRAIAAVLSDMDAEITALEARREKTRALKQGMMQELLTGRTRLV